MPRELSVEEIEELADKIIKKEISIRGAAEKYGIPRNTLSRRLESTLQEHNPEKYKELKKSNSKNQKSGGKIQGHNDEVYGNPAEIKGFYLTYLIYKQSSGNNKEIIERMGIPKATFYRKMKAFHIYLEQNKISFTNEQFDILPDETKEEVLIQKLRNRYKSLGKSPRSEDECRERISNFMKYILEEREVDEEIRIGRNDLYKIINSNIDIARLSLEEKIKPNIEKLDGLVGKKVTNLMLKNKPFMFSFSRERIEELIEIADSHNSLLMYARSSDRSSPELLYAFFEYAKEQGLDVGYVNQINRHAKSNGIKNGYLLKRFPYKAKTREIVGSEIND